MPLSITRNAEFAGVNVIGKRIFDLSLVATMPQSSRLHTFVKEVADRARPLGYHVLPAEQMHVTVINPLFMMEKESGGFTDVQRVMFETPEEQRMLFAGFNSVVMKMADEGLFDNELTLSASDVLFRPRDLKVLMPANAQWKAMLGSLEERLKSNSPWFDFLEGPPLLQRNGTDYVHATVLRFPMDIDAAKHEALLGIVEDEAGKVCEDLMFKVSRQNLLIVMFTGLFEPWVREASLIRST